MDLPYHEDRESSILVHKRRKTRMYAINDDASCSHIGNVRVLSLKVHKPLVAE